MNPRLSTLGLLVSITLLVTGCSTTESNKDQTDYYHLKYTKQSGQVVVASSGWDQAGWEEIPNGSLLVVDRVGQDVKLEKIT